MAIAIGTNRDRGSFDLVDDWDARKDKLHFLYYFFWIKHSLNSVCKIKKIHFLIDINS